MRLPTVPILSTLVSPTRAADPRISCSRSSYALGTVFIHTIIGYGNSAFPDSVCKRLKTSLNTKSDCITYIEHNCYTVAEGTYIFSRFEVFSVCHSGVSFLFVPFALDVDVDWEGSML